MSIQPLPDNVIAQIKSSSAITTLNGAVGGLIRNSLDSKASKVTVAIDYIRGSCYVEDNGTGILPAEFEYGGGLGKLHFTSKYPPHEATHGKCGMFLASLASLSLLSITSHHYKYHTHNSIQIHNSDILARHVPSLPGQRLLSFPHGTRVAARDLFGSMPVRVKQRAIDAERGVHSRHWEHLKRDIVALILAWDDHVSVSVREPTNRWAFSICSGREHVDDEDSGRDLTARVSRVLHQIRLSDESNVESWVPLRASAGRLSVTGVVSLHPVATKRIQFISIGIQPVPNENGSNVLYEEINRIFSNSSYGMEEVDDAMIQGQNEMEKDGQRSKEGFTNQELKGRKGVDRWPMFYIKICLGGGANSVPYRETDEFLDERHGNLTAIINILKAVTYEFLKKYHFRPKRIRGTRDDYASKKSRSNSPTRSTPRKPESWSMSASRDFRTHPVGDLATTQLRIRSERGPRSRPESPFDLWSRIKSGSPQLGPRDEHTDKQLTGSENQAIRCSVGSDSYLPKGDFDSAPPLFGANGDLLRPPFVTALAPVSNAGQGNESTRTEECILSESIRWTSTDTGKTSMIDPRTGFIVRPPNSCPEEHDKVNLVRRKPSRPCDGSTSDIRRGVWLEELLSSWENPVFENTETPIPTSFNVDGSMSSLSSSLGCSAWLGGLPEVGPPLQGRVSKTALRGAEIIAQVDRKYIFAKVLVDSSAYGPKASNAMPSLLIIIDQHAADERCRVESLMRDYFERLDKRDESGAVSATPVARAELLERPLQFDIPARDAIQLERTATHFARWGVHYRVTSEFPTEGAGHRQVIATKLPPSIAERCRSEPRLLAELLRKGTWKVDEHLHHDARIKASSTQDGETTTPHWITQFHGCPEGILDMINSRACRSSIMFNDPLSKDECANLLERLADCVFPFQCAHGRPSMVPLVDLGDNMAHTPKERGPVSSFRKAFKVWNTKR